MGGGYFGRASHGQLASLGESLNSFGRRTRELVPGAERTRLCVKRGDRHLAGLSVAASTVRRSVAACPHSPTLTLPMPRDGRDYPQLRFMGSKYRLLPWIESVLAELEFETALDAFSGSGCVSYLMKTRGKRVHANDFLAFARDLAAATVANSTETLTEEDVALLTDKSTEHETFIEDTFRGIFFTDDENRFLDRLSCNLHRLTPQKAALARAAAYRSCLKRQPRGVFTVGGNRYDDGRRDLRTPLQRHFLESVDIFNGLVFDNGHENEATCGDVFELDGTTADLVYLDPPYVPRADDNCYIKRYHFLEGLATYWRGVELHPTSRVRKLRKRFTPFSYRRTAEDAFDRLFAQFARSTIVLSYSSNGFPDLERLVELMSRHKRDIVVHERDHRYHFGTHGRVSVERAVVTEYLIVGA
jgi:adenine-specific DNA-methyltransferase